MYNYSIHQLLRLPRVMGRRLKPLCLGHIDLLYALDHPALKTVDLSPPELAGAVWICSQGYEQAADKVRRRRHEREIRAMGRRVVFFDLAKAGADFAEYFDVFLEGPERYDDERVSRMRAPWHLCVFAMIQEKTNFSPLATWSLPLPRAFELAAAIGVNQGDESLVPADEYELRDAIAGGA